MLLTIFYDNGTKWCCTAKTTNTSKGQEHQGSLFHPPETVLRQKSHWLRFPDVNPKFLIFKSCICLCLQGKYHGNPMHIAVIISNCLREERRILAAASMPVQVMNYISLICSMLICSHAFWNKSCPLIMNSTRVICVHWGLPNVAL